MSQHPMYLLTRYIKACGDNAPKLQEILDKEPALIVAKGSQHKHQAWEGGYLQHVTDCMQIARLFFNHSGWEIPFTWGSVVLVLFLHDIEKPFMQLRMAQDPEMPVWTKVQRERFRDELIKHYNIWLTDEERLAMKYVEGEGDDYNTTERLMNELGALCHAADTLSARLWHSRNKPENT